MNGFSSLTDFDPTIPSQTNALLGQSQNPMLKITQEELDAIGNAHPKYYSQYIRPKYLGGQGGQTTNQNMTPQASTALAIPPRPTDTTGIGQTTPTQPTGGRFSGLMDRMKKVDPRVWFSIAAGLNPRNMVATNMANLLTQQKTEGLAKEKLLKEQSPWGKIEPYKYTPESIAEFDKTSDYGKLIPIEKSGKGLDAPMSQQVYAQMRQNYPSLPEYDPSNPPSYRDINEWTKGSGAEKTQTPEQLTHTALYDSDPQKREEAKSILDAMEQRDIRISGSKAEASLDVKGKEIDIPGIAESIAEGQDARVAVKGSMGNPVASKAQSLVLKKYPKFDFIKSDANYKWATSSVNMRTISYIEGSIPRLAMLADQSKKLGNADWNTWNKVWNAVNKEFGKPEVTNFESNRNAIVQEVNTALSGSSTGSDLRVKIELENLSNARSPQQMMGAINNLYMALQTRADVNMSPLYPLEVVQGKKTMGQYQNEMRQKYSGVFGEQTEGNKNIVPNRETLFKELRNRPKNKDYSDKQINDYIDKTYPGLK